MSALFALLRALLPEIFLVNILRKVVDYYHKYGDWPWGITWWLTDEFYSRFYNRVTNGQ